MLTPESWNISAAASTLGVATRRFVVGPIPGGVLVERIEFYVSTDASVLLQLSFGFALSDDVTAASIRRAKAGLGRAEQSLDDQGAFRVDLTSTAGALVPVGVHAFDPVGPLWLLVAALGALNVTVELIVSAYGRRVAEGDGV